MPAQIRIADRYDLLERLGEGGMGIVYRALDTKTRSDVAIKTMRDGTDPLAVEMFSREWGVLAGLSHPNIVDVRDVGEMEEDGQRKPFFVMPLLPGKTLGQLIESSSPRLTVQLVVEIALQVCRGLQAAHDRGLVHRDLKPSNIFVMEDDTAKIIDFGIVHLAGTRSVTGHKGTWQYMAPEQTEMKASTPVSDLFALGVVCYEALTVRKPFARKSPAETIEAIRKYIPPAVSEINPRVNGAVSMVIHKAMAKQPIHRFANARDFADTLQRAYQNLPIERFDRAKIQPRIQRASKAFSEGDFPFASEILTELQAEGHIDAEITVLKGQIDEAIKQKKVRQLLESARTRIEQDEVPLALEKLREVLDLDSGNAEAIAMRADLEDQRSERQIDNWMSLARQHLGQQDFTQARQAVREVIAIHAGEPRALQLLAEVEQREQESIAIRGEMEQLYSSAMKAYHNGELSTALTKMARILVLARETPDAAIPERDAVYQNFYNQVRSERHTIQNTYEEGRRGLTDRNFDKTLKICDQLLAKYPNDPLFQALRLEAVEAQRQEFSAYIAEVQQRAQAEPDLDRRVKIHQEACERYPNEQQFQQSLKLTRERRDLVNSILAKARHYEENGQFTEAIGQWDILRNIHPTYPGMAFETEQLGKRRERQVRDDARSRVVAQIDRALETGAFVKARDLALSAISEFPDDQEFAGLERLARQGMERSQQAQQLFEYATLSRTEGRTKDAEDLLRQALGLDDRNPAIRALLMDVLLDQARSSVDSNWREAEKAVNDAADLDSAHPALRGLRSLIAEAKRKEDIGECLAAGRELQSAGDLHGALARAEATLAIYPGDPRLVQFRSTLQHLIEDQDRRAHRKPASAVAPAAPPPPNPIPAPEIPRPPVGKTPEGLPVNTPVAAVQPSDVQPANLQRATEIVQPPNLNPPNSNKDTTLFSSAEFAPTTFEVPHKPIKAPLPQAIPPSAGPGSGKTAAKVAAEKSQGASAAVGGAVARAATAVSGATSHPATSRKALVVALSSLLAIILLAVVPRLYPKKAASTAPAPPSTVPASAKAVVSTRVRIYTDPDDAEVLVDGQVQKDRSFDIAPGRTHSFRVSRVGYKPVENNQPPAEWNVKLDPEPLHIEVTTSEKAGKVFLDGRQVGTLAADGSFQGFQFPPDGGVHKLSVKTGTGEDLFAVGFQSSPGKVPLVNSLDAKDLVAVSSLANEAIIFGSAFGGKPPGRVRVGGSNPVEIPKEGLHLQSVTANNQEIAFEAKDRLPILIGAGNAPVLHLALKGNPLLGTIYVTLKSDIPGAKLLIDDVEAKRALNGRWWVQKPAGAHKLKLVAEGYFDSDENITLAKSEVLTRNLGLNPRPKFATLSIQGGTPGADVYLNGARIGRVSELGSFSYDQVQPGEHVIELRKPLYESRPIRRTFAAGQTIRLEPGESQLTAFGIIEFQLAPAAAKAWYEIGGDVMEAKTSGINPVKPGHYKVTVSAQGYQTETQEFDVAATKTHTVKIKLQQDKTEAAAAKPLPDMESLFQNPSQVSRNGQWLKVQSGVQAVKAGVPDLVVLVQKPGKEGFFKLKKLSMIVIVGGQQKVVYEFSDKKLSRRLLGGGKPEDVTLIKTPKDLSIYKVAIHLESNRIVLNGENGKALDEIGTDPHEVSSSQIAFAGDAYFEIRTH